MNRASPAPASRAAQHLISSKGVCNCGQALDLQKRSIAAVGFIVEAINHLDRIPSTTFIADQAPDDATLALIKARKALSALENP